MKISVEKSPEQTVLATFASTFIDKISISPEIQRNIANAFRLVCRVPDVWRYTVQVRAGLVLEPLLEVNEKFIPSKFLDRVATDAVGTKTIMLLMESPHIDEYEIDLNGNLVPIAPAQSKTIGGAGRAIKVYGHLVLNKIGLPDGDYSLLLVNPVQYHCSLSLLRPGPKKALARDVRDHVWRVLWKLPFVQNNFHARCRLYQPHTVLNCCTKELRDEVTAFMCKSGFGASLFESEHPSMRWWSLNKKGIPVIQVTCDQEGAAACSRGRRAVPGEVGAGNRTS